MTARQGLLREFRSLLGNRIAPPRFILFLVVVALGTLGWHGWRGGSWGNAAVIGFDLGVALFLVSLWPLMRVSSAAQMRIHAAQNDANRFFVLVITGIAVLAVMTAIVAELPAAKQGALLAMIKLVAVPECMLHTSPNEGQGTVKTPAMFSQGAWLTEQIPVKLVT